jgi:protein gp37
MYRGKRRYGDDPREVVRSKTTFRDPLKWDDAKLIFACSWSDWFIEEADSWREEAWDIVRSTPRHIYQILTKRPERILDNLPEDWDGGWHNVWLGVSIECQELMHRKRLLLEVPAQVRFLSLEPLIGPLELGNLRGFHWVITGGESGPAARPMDPQWAIDVKEACREAGIPFFHKQNGGTRKIAKTWGGRELDGRVWNGMPSQADEIHLNAA